MAAASLSFTMAADDAAHNATAACDVVRRAPRSGVPGGARRGRGSFGSMRLLRVLPVDFARIDRALVAAMLAHPRRHWPR